LTFARALVALTTLPLAGLPLLAASATSAWGKDPKTIVYPGNDAAVLLDSGTISKIPPDPPALKSRMQWVFDLKWAQGEPSLLAVTALDVGSVQETPRAMGRFALELFEGPTLIERVRFDFPLLGAGENVDAGNSGPPSFEKKLTTRIGVVFPATDRGTRLELWDRATNRRYGLPWPIEEKEKREAARDGGAEAGK
jgi:hypothetical protein